MTKEKASMVVDELGLMQRRFEFITVAKFRDKSRIKKAMKIQDALRGKSIGWNSTKEIRRWRDSRYGSPVNWHRTIASSAKIYKVSTWRLPNPSCLYQWYPNRNICF
ncbi:MAG: hypothetical protein HY051_00765 [Candidatus Aenigmarchaeota archaeon]|nr:hypothetical protein [Candidatus Aenigmarchaeota archaeon]